MFVDVFNTVSTTLTTFETQAVSNLATYLTTFAHIGGIIVLMLLGLSYLQAVPMNIAAWKLVKALGVIAAVIAFALSADNYNTYIGKHLMELPDDLMQAIMPAESGDSISIGEYLDTTVDKTGEAIGEIWKTGTWGNGFGPCLLACVLFLLLCALGAAAMFSILLGKIGIALIVAVGPLFVLFLLSPYTRDFFTRWLSYALQMSILQVLIGGVILIARGVLDVYIQQLTQPAEAISNSPGAVIAPAIVMLVLAGMFVQLPSMASSLTGGIGLSSGVSPGSLAGAAMGAAIALRRRFGGGNAPTTGSAGGAGGGTVSEGGSDGQVRNEIIRSQRTQEPAAQPQMDAQRAPDQRSSGSAAAFARMQADMRREEMKRQNNENDNSGGNK